MNRSGSKKNSLLILFFCQVALFLCSPLYAENNACQIAKDALQQASDIRKLRIKETVPCLLQDKEQIEDYLLKTVDKQLPEQKLAYEEQVYKQLGLFPENFDYKSGIVKLYLSQIGGYYDPEKDHFVMAKWLPVGMQTTIALHELTHALQDQYYDLDKFINPAINNGDVILARSALVEGDATAVMYDYGRKMANQPGIHVEKNIEGLIYGNSMGGAVSSDIPKSLQAMLVFPYTDGLRFVHSILKERGYSGLDQVFKRPPRSSEEILTPEKYWQPKADFVVYQEADLRLDLVSEKFTKVYEDTVGQLATSALFNMFNIVKADIEIASKGWGGDRVMLFVDQDDSFRIVWRINWDSVKDADEFWTQYMKVLRQRYALQTNLPFNVWHDLSDDKKFLVRRIENSFILLFAS